MKDVSWISVTTVILVIIGAVMLTVSAFVPDLQPLGITGFALIAAAIPFAILATKD